MEKKQKKETVKIDLRKFLLKSNFKKRMKSAIELFYKKNHLDTNTYDEWLKKLKKDKFI